MRDPFTGSDPLGLEPTAEVVRIQETRLQRAIQAYRHGILLPDVAVADRTAAAEPTGFVDDAGKPLTMEERQAIAAKRQPYDALRAQLEPEAFAYDQDLADRTVEPVGESAQKVLDANPRYRVVLPREFVLPASVLTDDAARIFGGIELADDATLEIPEQETP